jgi:cytochrome bd-type quinol oxidase subunit 2
MWRTLPGLLVIILVFIVYDVTVDAKDGSKLYGCDPTGFWLPLSSALQMLAFTLTAAVAMLLGLRTVTDPSPHIADRKVSNRLFGTILYGLLWLPMRSAYEHASPEARGLLHNDSFWLVAFIFIAVEALLVFSVLYKQGRHIAPIFVMIVSIFVLLIALMYPNICTHLFGNGAHLYIYLLLFGLGLVGYLGLIPDERKNRS